MARKRRADAVGQQQGTSTNPVHSWRPAPVTVGQLADLACWWGTAGESATIAQAVAVTWAQEVLRRGVRVEPATEQREATHGNGNG